MTRSKLRKIRRIQSKQAHALLSGLPLAGAIFIGAPVVQAQQAEQESGGLEEVVVTALKTQQNLQDAPLSIQAIGTERLEELNVSSFEDYVKFLPSVSFQQAAPGFARVFMRGAAAGDNGNHSGPQPGVGQYLDEQPITTIQGALDIHMYDIARVEALAGPQGTLYGASSQSGTIRIITNKPDKSGFDAGVGIEGNTLAGGDQGYLGEGFVNIPLGDRAAIRLVGWARHDAGYVDNVAGTRTFPSSGISMQARAKDNYNDADTYGLRAALKLDLNDTWSITPTVMAQRQKSNGVFASDTNLGNLEVSHYHPESSDDQWMQAALTVEGKLSNFDLTFNTSYLKRDVDSNSDYSDYAFFYDTLFGSGVNFFDDNGNLINPSQYIRGKDAYTKQSNELRISTAADKRLRFVGGLFAQRQTHDIQQAYRIDGLATASEVTGWPDTFWLTKQKRIDRDYAVFGELTFDLTEKLAVTAGARRFRSDNSLEGFFGFGLTNPYDSGTGEQSCTEGPFETAPCTDLPLREIKQDGTTYRYNAAYHIDDHHMIYATVSEGFRPGGVNRRGTFPPYKADFLKNLEFGVKTSWLGDTLRLNAAAFRGDWDDFQFSFLGENGLTNVTNAGQAVLKGIEADLQWKASDALTLYGGFAIQRAELAQDFCKSLDADGNPLRRIPCLANNPDDFAPEGTRLPTTPRFKLNLTGRYEFQMAGFDSHFQTSIVHQGVSTSALLPSEAAALGEQEEYTLVDLALGIARDKWDAELFVDNAFDQIASLYRYTECDTSICGGIVYSVTTRPRTIGLKFHQKF